MKKKWQLSLVIVFAMTTCILYIYQMQLKEKVETYREELMIKNEMEELEHHLANKSFVEEGWLDYTTWEASNELAEMLYEDSEGAFEKEWGWFLAGISQQYGVDPLIVYELLRTETGGTFDPTLVGPETQYGRAYGMAQFMHNTAPWIAEKAGLPYEDDLLFDPVYSIQLAVVYLDFLYDKYEDWDHALTAYHRGMYGLEKYIEENGNAESWYAVEIQENAENYDWVAFTGE
ncbi:lytic transglycosylase domain-containing protein [Halalkalibacterium halodurans]|uniref:lytic transglycosylase domain-containing protein n=1 Tax=Halalkalibacterium halodurans TaxID=86665 RepID=UPI002AAA254B|nr:lytic transglycosylase domain-containing protein [Halalkalibacterium halodurans]MDY7221915.1 lytic transglycosylase domain-containing protein [Halalkalibacterium halodurans]MDY7241191.1 lytic transglycosylase domain-containing protein [Halalkalibacterium halodurans]